MTGALLKVDDLSVYYDKQKEDAAVAHVALHLAKGESLGLIGESGSGKSSLALSIMGMLQKRARVEGEIAFAGTSMNGLSEEAWNRYRWSKIALVFQNSLNVLNPVLTVGEQISECILTHSSLGKRAAREKTEGLLEMVGLEASWAEAFPHQLSGGMRQKALIAMALSCDPELLLVDEPTMALDAVAKQEVVRLLIRLQEEKGISMLVISHEFEIIQKTTTRTMVMYGGAIMEEGPTEEILKEPLHPYTRGLIYASPAVHPFRDMWGIQGEREESGQKRCPFYNRCNQAVDACKSSYPRLQEILSGRKVACLRGGIVTILEGQNLYKSYRTANKVIHACKGCSILVRSGEVVVLIGESGSGKTTLAELALGLLEPDTGEVYFEGKRLPPKGLSSKKRGIQMVFQDPLSATNDQFTVEEAVREPLDITKEGSKEERNQAVHRALQSVQLPRTESFLSRRCYTLSGGQRQRVAIARSLVMEPKLLIADEISAMLDPSTGANILRLLKGLQNAKGFSMLYITHDLALAQKIADKVYVMHKGTIVEKGAATEIFTKPKNDYTKQLLGYAEGYAEAAISSR
jgi:peptide/nickel transport system ATP-binding protein